MRLQRRLRVDRGRTPVQGVCDPGLWPTELERRGRQLALHLTSSPKRWRLLLGWNSSGAKKNRPAGGWDTSSSAPQGFEGSPLRPTQGLPPGSMEGFAAPAITVLGIHNHAHLRETAEEDCKYKPLLPTLPGPLLPKGPHSTADPNSVRPCHPSPKQLAPKSHHPLPHR